uniref:Uncharacterized protein n=1 Tax=Plectus sambesii TaxID=2011161 RepID=A0A914XFZ1_9BILA
MAFLQEHFASGHGQQLSSIMYFFPQHPGQEIAAPQFLEPISIDWQSMDCNDEIMVLQQPQQPQQPQQQQQHHQPSQQPQSQQLYYQQPQRQPQHQQQVILTNGRPGANVISQAAAQTHAPQPQQQGQRSPVAATQGQMFVPHLLSFNQQQ